MLFRTKTRPSARRFDGLGHRGPGHAWATSTPQGVVSGAMVSTGADSLAGPARQVLHALVGVGAWAGFLSLWAWQIDGYLPVHWIGGLIMIGVGVVGYATLTPLWVRWNRNIYRRHHNRRSPIVCDVDFKTDRLGRKLLISPAVLLHPTLITVDLDETNGTKRYLVPAPKAEPLAPEAEPLAPEAEPLAPEPRWVA
jgi:hypothetical protein